MYDQRLWLFHMHWRRSCILSYHGAKLDISIIICLINLSFRSSIFLFTFCPLDLSCVESGTLKASYHSCIYINFSLCLLQLLLYKGDCCGYSLFIQCGGYNKEPRRSPFRPLFISAARSAFGRQPSRFQPPLGLPKLKDPPCLKSCFHSGWPTPSDWLMQDYKIPAFWLQPQTALNGHPIFRAPYRISRGIHWDCIAAPPVSWPNPTTFLSLSFHRGWS